MHLHAHHAQVLEALSLLCVCNGVAIRQNQVCGVLLKVSEIYLNHLAQYILMCIVLPTLH